MSDEEALLKKLRRTARVIRNNDFFDVNGGMFKYSYDHVAFFGIVLDNERQVSHREGIRIARFMNTLLKLAGGRVPDIEYCPKCLNSIKDENAVALGFFLNTPIVCCADGGTYTFVCYDPEGGKDGRKTYEAMFEEVVSEGGADPEMLNVGVATVKEELYGMISDVGALCIAARRLCDYVCVPWRYAKRIIEDAETYKRKLREAGVTD
jgi:hypothetical protein